MGGESESRPRSTPEGQKRPRLVHIVVLCVALGLWYISPTPMTTPPVITIADGRIQGNVRYSRDGYEYREFLGIPYAMAPVGPRNFQPPVPVEPWGSEVKQTTKYPPNCVQFNSIVATITGDMDCLYLNVFSRSKGGSEDTEKRKPVLVYIHGGAFSCGGSDSYHPEFLMDRDVVLVVMNYRLGPFGFLNLEDPDPGTQGAKGNMGLLDQNLALQWVQKNIGYFGGDNKRVTLIGLSAGAASTHFHILSPLSRGLFHRAVLQSGAALSPWALSNNSSQVAKQLGERLGCSTNTSEEMLRCFIDSNWKEVVRYQLSGLEPTRDDDLFLPSVDNNFMLKRPLDVLKSGDFPAIPTMWGVTSGEGGVRAARFEAMPELTSQLDREWSDLIGNVLYSRKRLSPAFTKGLRQLYFGKMSNFSENTHLFRQGMVTLLSDVWFLLPMHESVLFHAKRGAPTYLYYFNYSSNVYPGAYTIFSTIRLEDWMHHFFKYVWSASIDWIKEFVFGCGGVRAYGICHVEDLYQLWNVHGMTKWFAGKDAEFSRAFVNVIVDFANFTEPLTFRGVVWPAIHGRDLPSKDAEDSLRYMLMDNAERPTIIPEPFAERRKLMEALREQTKQK